MTTELQDLKTRLVALETEFMINEIGIAAPNVVPVGFWSGEPPYCTNRNVSVSLTEDGQDYLIHTYLIQVTFITGYMTEAYDTAAEQVLDEYMPKFLLYVDSHRNLQTEAYPDILENLDPRGVRITTGRFFPDPRQGGTADQVFSMACLVEAPIKTNIEQIW